MGRGCLTCYWQAGSYSHSLDIPSSPLSVLMGKHIIGGLCFVGNQEWIQIIQRTGPGCLTCHWQVASTGSTGSPLWWFWRSNTQCEGFVKLGDRAWGFCKNWECKTFKKTGSKGFWSHQALHRFQLVGRSYNCKGRREWHGSAMRFTILAGTMTGKTCLASTPE